VGAYYHAALKRPEGRFFRYSCWRMDNGAKLLEHSYLPNNYVNAIVKMIYFRPAHVVWLCDYHEEKDLNWKEIPSLKTWKPKQDHPLYVCLIVNLDRKEYINIEELLNLIAKDIETLNFDYSYVNEYQSKVVILPYHPLPFLTNCSKEPFGPGDYHGVYKYRARWKNDLIVSLPLNCEQKLISKRFKNITEKSLVPVDLFDMIDMSSNKFDRFLLARKLMRQEEGETISFAVKSYFDRISRALISPKEKIASFFEIFL